MPILCHLDRPPEGAACDPLGFFVEGWIHDGEGKPDFEAIEVVCAGEKIGETSVLSERRDVSAALGLPPGSRTGFQILCHAVLSAGALAKADAPGRPEISIEVRARRGGESLPLAARALRPINFDYRSTHFGHLLDRDFLPVVHREHIYLSGPSQAEGSDECQALIEKFVGPPPRRLLDVGCGLGAYGRKLRPRGYDWLGVEMKPADLAELARLGLPHQGVDGRTLPFPNRSFDTALCIEVLEHVEDLARFLTEVRRVAPALVVSVPNFELAPYLWFFRATPWHMLEADHKNFFTRWSLRHLLAQFYPRVEITAYGRMPMDSREGTPLYYHLFASARGDA